MEVLLLSSAQRFDAIKLSPETKMFHLLLRDVKHPVPDVVCGHLPVSVYQATPPAIFTDCEQTAYKMMKERYSQKTHDSSF